MAADIIDAASTQTPDFQQAANPAPAVDEQPKVLVSLPLDADLVAHFLSKTEPSNWQRHINDVLRFYVESVQISQANVEFDDALFQLEVAPVPA